MNQFFFLQITDSLAQNLNGKILQRLKLFDSFVNLTIITNILLMQEKHIWIEKTHNGTLLVIDCPH